MFRKIARQVAPVLLVALVAGMLLAAAPAAQAATQTFDHGSALQAGHATYVAADWRDHDRDRDRDRWRNDRYRYRDGYYYRTDHSREWNWRERERWEREHARRWNDHDRDDRYRR